MNIKNNTLKTAIEFWANKNTTYKYILEYFATSFIIIDILTEITHISKLEINNYIFGILMSQLYFDNVNINDDYAENQKEIENLILPVLNKIIAHLKSNEYRTFIINQQITGTKTIEIDGVKDVVSTKAILNHISRTGNFPLTPKDIEDIEQDYSNYFRQQNKINTTHVIDGSKIDYPKLARNYIFWTNIDDKVHGKKNIFKGITQSDFFNMILTADFTQINKAGISQRVKYNIHVLSRELGKDWGEKAAGKINTSLDECVKRTEFNEYDSLKNMYLQ